METELIFGLFLPPITWFIILALLWWAGGPETDRAYNRREARRKRDIKEALQEDNPDITTYPFVYFGWDARSIRRDMEATLKTKEGMRRMKDVCGIEKE